MRLHLILKMVRANSSSKSILPVVFLCVLGGCLKVASSNAVSCGAGSESQSIIPSGPELERHLQPSGPNDKLSERLRRVSGIGGYFSYFQSNVPVPQVVGRSSQSTSPFHDSLPVCTASFLDAAWKEKKQLVLWTSRNCLDYSTASGKVPVVFFGNTRVFMADAPRLRWPEKLRAKLAEGAKNGSSAVATKYLPFTGLDVHNFERLVVSLEDDFSKAGASSADLTLSPAAHTYLDTKIMKLSEEQSSYFLQTKERDPKLRQLVVKWVLSTEQQALFRAIEAIAATDLGCQSGKTKVCEDLKRDLSSEYAAGTRLLDDNERLKFEDLWQQGWKNPKKAIQETAQAREADFREIFKSLQSQMGKSSVTQTALSDDLKGIDLANLAFLHGNMSIPRVSDLSYQAVPFAHLMSLEREVSELVAGQQPTQSTPTPLQNSSQGAARLSPEDKPDQSTGFVFSDPIKFEPKDEGTMLSLLGIAPVGFVSFPAVQFGRHYGPTQNAADTKGAQPYANSSCP